MSNHHKLLRILIYLILCTPYQGFGNNTQPIGSTLTEETKCDLPAPTNYHVKEEFTTSITVAWDPPVIQPFQYNIKAKELPSGNLVYNQNIPGSSIEWTITNLLPNTQYEITATPICEDGSLSNNSGTTIGQTIILDLVSSGFSAPQNPLESCAIGEIPSFCTAYPAQGYVVNFRIEQVGNPSVFHDFGLYKAIGNCLVPSIKVDPSSTSYHFFCGSNTSMRCKGDYITIKHDNDQVAKITYSQNPSGFGSRIWGQTYAVNGVHYRIIRLECAEGHQDQFPIPCGAGNPNRPTLTSDREVGTLDETSLSATPNPFTHQLDVNIPFAQADKDVRINLYDLQGRCVLAELWSGNTTNVTLNTENLTPGMYFLRVESGDKSQTVKVVKTQ